MQLKFFDVDFGRFENFEIEDFGFFSSMMIRMIEDMATVTYTFARQRREAEVQAGLIEEVADLIKQGQIIDFRVTSESAFIPLPVLRNYARLPIPYTEEAISLFAKFVNFHLIWIITRSAETAEEQGSSTIRLTHILPYCNYWPWPFNRWC